MSQQNRNQGRERKHEEPKRDTASSNRYMRNSRESRNEIGRGETNPVSGLDRYRQNDLYERSSM